MLFIFLGCSMSGTPSEKLWNTTIKKIPPYLIILLSSKTYLQKKGSKRVSPISFILILIKSGKKWTMQRESSHGKILRKNKKLSKSSFCLTSKNTTNFKSKKKILSSKKNPSSKDKTKSNQESNKIFLSQKKTKRNLPTSQK